MQKLIVTILGLLTSVGIGLQNLAYAESTLTVYGLTTDGELVSFLSNAPETLLSQVAVSGLQTNETLVGIDFRPANNALYAVGDSSRLYTIDLTSGVATAVGTGPFATTLSGSSFGVDFNPAADRLRIVSNTDQNLRINPNNAAVAGVDTALTYDSNDSNNGTNPSILSVAYVNNVAGVSATTLLGIDSSLGIMVRQGGPNGATPFPNTGLLFSLGTLGVGTTVTNVGFDVAVSKTEGTQIGLLTLIPSSESSSKLYGVDLAGGAAQLLGTVGGSVVLVDVAISLTDRVSPQVLATGVDNRKIKKLKNLGIDVQYSCTEACSVTADLSASQGIAKKLGITSTGPAIIGTASETLDDSGVDTINIPLSTEALAGFGTKKGGKIESFTATVAVTITDSGGNTATDSFSVKFSK